MQKRKMIVTYVFHLYFFRFMFPENLESFSVFKNIDSDFYNFTVFVTSSIFLERVFPPFCKFITVLSRILGG